MRLVLKVFLVALVVEQLNVLAGWVKRLQTRFLGAVVPAAPSQPTVMEILTVRSGWLNGLVGSKILGPGF